MTEMGDVTTQTEAQDGFEDFAMATRFREAMTRHMISVLDQERPPLRKGTVTQIDPDIREVKVSFNGADPVRVKIGAIQPRHVGQVVHVQGKANDLWVVNVIGESALTDVSELELTAPAGFNLTGIIGGIQGMWQHVSGATRYEFNYADNSDFNDNISNLTFNTQFTVPGLDPLVTYYARVRAANSGGGRGPWSATVSTNPLDYPSDGGGAPPSDGLPPTSSPQPVVTPMLGAVIAQWIPVANADLVHYDVYASNTSGFTASPATFIGSTTGTFYVVRTLSNGTPVPLGQTLFIRLIARDIDGSAPVGPQGFAIPAYVNTGDVGNIDTGKIGDELPPASSPNAPAVSSGPGYLYVKWAHVSNADPVMYEVHVSGSGAGFVPGSNTLVGETPSNWFFVRNQGPGQNNDQLVFGANYWIRLIAKDRDGAAAPGTATLGTISKIGTVDIYEGTITAESAILADLAVGTAKIQNGAITNLKVADAAISTAKIQDLAVNTAKITDLAVSTAKIQNLAVTDAKINNLSATKITAGTIGAHTVILNGINSRLQSADYSSGTSGWLIRGDGYFEANSGNFRGTLAAGVSISSPTITGGTISGVNITGVTLTTQAGGQRIQLYEGTISFWDANSNLRGVLWAATNGDLVVSTSRMRFDAGANGNFTGSASFFSLETTGNFFCWGSINVAGFMVINTARQFVGTAINVSGNVIGSAVGTNYLSCQGQMDVSGIINGSNRVRASYGATSSPSFASISNVNTGFNIPSVGQAFIVCSGSNRVGYNGSDVILATTGTSSSGSNIASYFGAARHFTSSIKFKHDVNALEDSIVPDLKPITFRPNDNPDRVQAGFIAEEVADLDERLAVRGEDDEVIVYDTHGMMAHIVKYIQELDKRVIALEGAA